MAERSPTGGCAARPRILVMDDEAPICELAAELLGCEGYEVQTSADGEEASRKYEAALEAGRPYDVVILDLTVRGGLGGKETIARLLQMDPARQGDRVERLLAGPAGEPVPRFRLLRGRQQAVQHRGNGAGDRAGTRGGQPAAAPGALTQALALRCPRRAAGQATGACLDEFQKRAPAAAAACPARARR